MKALTYIERRKFARIDKLKPDLLDERDAIVVVTLGSICTSDLHIKDSSVPRAVPALESMLTPEMQRADLQGESHVV